MLSRLGTINVGLVYIEDYLAEHYINKTPVRPTETPADAALTSTTMLNLSQTLCIESITLSPPPPLCLSNPRYNGNTCIIKLNQNMLLTSDELQLRKIQHQQFVWTLFGGVCVCIYIIKSWYVIEIRWNKRNTLYATNTTSLNCVKA